MHIIFMICMRHRPPVQVVNWNTVLFFYLFSDLRTLICGEANSEAFVSLCYWPYFSATLALKNLDFNSDSRPKIRLRL